MSEREGVSSLGEGALWVPVQPQLWHRPWDPGQSLWPRDSVAPSPIRCWRKSRHRSKAGPPGKAGESFLGRPRPTGCPAQSTPSALPTGPTRAGLDQSSQLIGHRDNAFTLHSSSWGLEHRGPPFSVAPLLDLPMPLMAPPLPLPTEARCSCCSTRLVSKWPGSHGEEGNPRRERMGAPG